jgi:predicted  nucleic acid-binding Zn-ribbon protein
MSVAQLEKEFKSLNKKYLIIDKEMDSLAKNKLDTWDLEQELDKIQTRMSKTFGELKNRN